MTGSYKYYPHSNQIENSEDWFELKTDRINPEVLCLCRLARKPSGGIQCTFITKVREEPDLSYTFRFEKRKYKLELFEDNTATISPK